MEKEALTLDTIYVPSGDIVAREIEGDMIIVPLVAGIGDADDELYTLNETGHAIWRMLDGDKSLRQVIAALAEEYDAPIEQMETDVIGFASEMVRRGILALKG